MNEDRFIRILAAHAALTTPMYWHGRDDRSDFRDAASWCEDFIRAVVSGERTPIWRAGRPPTLRPPDASPSSI